MKKRFYIIIISIISGLLLNGCIAANSGLTNQFGNYGILTEVQLAGKNYKVIGEVSGAAEAQYIFGFGGTNEGLIARAKRQMMQQANMEGTSRALANVSIETYMQAIPHPSYPVFSKIKVIATGTVIEFTER